MMEARFLRTEMLLGQAAMEKLGQAHVAVFGLGGVGSWAAEALARSGVGRLTLVDSDRVSETNINRQLCALEGTIGRPKAEVMAERALAVNPDIQVRPLCAHYSGETREQFFDRPYDYVLDAIDLVSCKLDLVLMALERGIPSISALGTGNKLDPTRFEITDISQTRYCPLARVMRRELRRRGVEHLRVLYSPEPALKPQGAGEAPPPGRRSIPGSVVWVPACAGLMLAGEVVKALAGL